MLRSRGIARRGTSLPDRAGDGDDAAPSLAVHDESSRNRSAEPDRRDEGCPPPTRMGHEYLGVVDEDAAEADRAMDERRATKVLLTL